MKKLILLTLLVFMIYSTSFPHGQQYHQNLTIYAYNMLKRNLGSDIPMIKNHLGEATS